MFYLVCILFFVSLVGAGRDQDADFFAGLVDPLQTKQLSFFGISKIGMGAPNKQDRAKLFSCIMVTNGSLIPMRNDVLESRPLLEFRSNQKKKVCLSLLTDEQNSLPAVQEIKEASYVFIEGDACKIFFDAFRGEIAKFYTATAEDDK